MTVDEVLARSGVSEAAVLHEHALLTGLVKVSRAEAECARFERKYGTDLAAFRARLQREQGREDLAEEDDLLDWEHAEASIFRPRAVAVRTDDVVDRL